MPEVLEIREIANEIWAKIPCPTEVEDEIYICTEAEMREIKRAAIDTFLIEYLSQSRAEMSKNDLKLKRIIKEAISEYVHEQPNDDPFKPSI